MQESSLFDVLDSMSQAAHAPRVPLPLPGTQEKPVTPAPSPAEARDDGIKRALDHADAVEPKWSERAGLYVRGWLQTHGDPFLMEEVVEAAKREGFPAPPDSRSWGGVIRSLAKDKAVLKVGAREARTSNLSLKILWKRSPDWTV